MQDQAKNTTPDLVDSAPFQLDRVEEFLLDKKDREKIQQLLVACFPDYPSDTIYYKQIPSFRYLARTKDEVIGHFGVDYRVINNGGQVCHVLCLSDVCVANDYRDQQIASKMLQQMEQDARQNEIDFLILISNDSKIYYHLGYRSQANSFRWLMIQNNKSLGVVQRKLGADVIMVKRLSDKKWSSEITDLLGPIF